MDILDKKLDFEFKTNQQIISLISEIDLFRGKWEYLENKNRYNLGKTRLFKTVGSAVYDYYICILYLHFVSLCAMSLY